MLLSGFEQASSFNVLNEPCQLGRECVMRVNCCIKIQAVPSVYQYVGPTAVLVPLDSWVNVQLPGNVLFCNYLQSRPTKFISKYKIRSRANL